MDILPRAITFDCYGTLIDWEGEIQRFFGQLLVRRHISHVDARALQRHWEEVQFQYISQAYRPYRQVLRETMKLACADYQLPYAEADVEAFADSMGHWRPFADTREALLALQKIVKVALTTPQRYLL
jgi:2-haloacid dehalogenase